jgi:hypothetical protein
MSAWQELRERVVYPLQLYEDCVPDPLGPHPEISEIIINLYTNNLSRILKSLLYTGFFNLAKITKKDFTLRNNGY